MLFLHTIELAVGNIVRRVLKVIREVQRGELETHDMDEYDEEDEGDFDDMDEDDDSPPPSARNHSSTSSQVGSVGERPQLTVQSSMFRLLSDASHVRSADAADKKSNYNLKPLIIQEINEEIIEDLDGVYKGIADQALDYIHAK